MKLSARKEVRITSSQSEGWDRWFAWYPVTIATSRFSAHWVWLDFVERKWSTCIYGSGRKKRRYRLPKKEVHPRLRNLAKLTRKLDAAWRRDAYPLASRHSDAGRQAVNPLQRYERRRKWTALFLWAVGILVALLVAIVPRKDAFTIVTPVLVVLIALTVHLTLASDKAEN